MTEKNPRLQEWFEKLLQIDVEHIQKTRIMARRARPKDSKIRYPRFSTQMIRRDIVRGLIELYEKAIYFALSRSLSRKEREKWGRLAAYVGQTINTVIKTYDEVQIEKAIEELKEYVQKHAE